MEVTAIILAGGKSRRLGRDKTLLKVDNQLLIAGLVEKCRQLFEEIIIVCDDLDKFQFPGVGVVTDNFRGQGPMAGIEAGLQAAAYPYGFVLACDMPFVTTQLMERVAAERFHYDVVIPCIEQYMEPLFGVYRKELQQPMARLLAGGQRCILDLYPEVNMCYLPKEAWQEAAAQPNAFFNINYPEDYLNFLNQRAQNVKQQYHKKYYRDFCNQQGEEEAYVGKK